MAGTRSRTATNRWREQINGWRRSDLSIAEYCRQNELSQASFFAWRKRLAASDAVAATRRPAEGVGGPSRFLELSPPAWPPSCGVQLTLPSGTVVALPADASSELVAAAIRAAMVASAPEARPC